MKNHLNYRKKKSLTLILIIFFMCGFKLSLIIHRLYSTSVITTMFIEEWCSLMFNILFYIAPDLFSFVAQRI